VTNQCRQCSGNVGGSLGAAGVHGALHRGLEGWQIFHTLAFS